MMSLVNTQMGDNSATEEYQKQTLGLLVRLSKFK